MKGRIGEKGSTLIELMAGLAVTALILVGVLGLIYQEWSGTATAKTAITTSQEIGRTIRLISQDGAMTTSTNLVDGNQPTDQITMNWIERHDFVDIPHSTSYWLEADKLYRNYDGIVTTVSRTISQIEFSQLDRLLIVSISSNPRWWILDKIEEKTYRIFLRPTEEI